LRKVFAPVGIVLKGSGFYKTDSRAAGRGSKGPKKEKESTTESASSSTSESSSSKSETKSSTGKDNKTESKSA
jgi:predicted nucleic acid-binding Zn ribbon protein